MCRQKINRISLVLVDLRCEPSSNGSGVHALKFSRRRQLRGKHQTSSLSKAPRGRTSSGDSESTITSGSVADDMEEEEEESVSPPGPPSGSPETPQKLPGVPPLSVQELCKMMLDVTRDAAEVKETWEEVNRNNQLKCVGSWPFRIRMVGLQDLSFLSRLESCEMLSVRVELVYAAQVLETKYTKPFRREVYACRLEEWLWFDRPLNSIPLGARLTITVFDCTGKFPRPQGTNGDLSLLGGISPPPAPPQLYTSTSISSTVSLEHPSNVVAGGSIQIFDQRHVVRSGFQQVVLWEGQFGERTMFCVNSPLEDYALAVFEMDEFLRPLYYEMPPLPAFPVSSTKDVDVVPPPPSDMSPECVQEEGQNKINTSPSKSRKGGILNRLKWSSATGESSSKSKNRPSIPIPSNVSKRTKEILRMDPIQVYSMGDSDKAVLWEDRLKLVDVPESLARVLYAANWCDRSEQEEALLLLSEWKALSARQAMELLDCRHGDYRVREYAVRCLESASDNELEDLLLQLTQVLKYEPFHTSPLARFLLRRAWQNPREIGIKLFWSLRSEMHNKRFSQRFGVILRSYLENASDLHLQDLSQQLDVQNLLVGVADVVQNKFSSKMDRLNFVRTELHKINDLLPQSFQLCLDPKIVVKGMVVQGCKVMNSKKKPLWLKFGSVDPEEGGGIPSLVMFKAGDDLRQDQMTLQMLRIMNQLWLSEGLDMRMTLYGCITTGDELGLIEVVTNSETIAGIQKKHGKLGALSARPLRTWLLECNVGQNFNSIVDNFVHSCAGYCVATYVMGIGDRHSDNIMIKRDGRLFHIDFGHFLGHFKSKFGVKRERAPFVFTKEMAFVMGSKNEKAYKNFVQICCKAYNILRHNGNELINLFRLMIPAGMPELVCDQDIQYMCQKLCMDKTDAEASESFKREINNSLSDTYRRVDNLIHNIKTGGG
mmetsp:Transcript_21393/g.34853  ORF Transcript_21393/g.34853 Transcript_21393/m.34853 type:complete len:940 (+) Transcript_21393:3108-5927(+)